MAYKSIEPDDRAYETDLVHSLLPNGSGTLCRRPGMVALYGERLTCPACIILRRNGHPDYLDTLLGQPVASGRQCQRFKIFAVNGTDHGHDAFCDAGYGWPLVALLVAILMWILLD